MNKKHINIAGMHCRSCELLIEKELMKINGISKVRVDHRTGRAEINYEGSEPATEAISEAVETSGYRLGNNAKLPVFSREKVDYFNLLKGVGLVLLLYLAIKGLGLTELGAGLGEKAGLGAALLVGLVAGISTCMALIGGLVLGLSARHAELHPEASAVQKFRPHLFFNLGRIGGFFLLGGLIGLLGATFKPSGNLLGIMTIVIGGTMLFLGLKLLGIFPVLQNKNFVLPGFIARSLGLQKEVKEYSHRRAVVLGAATFFLPCGFTQAMQLYAVSTGSFWLGGLAMSLFAFGTSFGLLGIGGLSSVMKGKAAKLFFSTVGVAVILFGIFNIANASQLFSSTSVSQPLSSQPVNGQVQEIRMTQDYSGYRPNVLTVKKGIPVKWIINSTNNFTCAASIVMPKFGISKYLQKGENVIEFTPTETGEIPFSCSMGMYRGKFIVVDSDAEVSKNTSDSQQLSATLPGAGSCHGGGGGCGGCGGGKISVNNQ